MEISVQSIDDNKASLRLTGRVTQEARPADGDPLADVAGPEIYRRRVMLDMQPVEFLDSSGIGWLLSVHRRCREEGGALALHSTPPMVANTLKLLKLHNVMTIVEDQRAAERSLGLDAT